MKKANAKRPRAWNSTLAAPSAPTLKRSAMKRGRKIKPKKRSAKERDRVYGPRAFVEWIHAQPCAVCGFVGRVEQAHAKGGGMGRKDDWTSTLALCAPHPVMWGPHWSMVKQVEGCHRELHRVGIKTFEVDHNVVLVALAAKTRARYLAYVHQQENTSTGTPE